VDEWSLNLTAVNVRHWSDIAGTPKGNRLVTVRATLNIDSAAIEGRLRADLDSARTAQEQAESAVAIARSDADAAAAASAAAEEDEALSAAASSASSALSSAESSLRTIDRSMSTAQRNYDRAMSSERTRLGRLLSCDRVDLITQGRNVRAMNSRDMGTSCRVLSSEDSVQVTWIYLTRRYEIPIGITYSLNREPHANFFAAASFTHFDPR
jgi:hypothetical protein